MNHKIYIKNIAIFLIALIISLPFIFAEEYNRIYDANGNLVYDSQDDIYREYNELNQLSRTRQNNATGILLQEYTFDPIKERIFIKDEFYTNGSLKSSTYYFDDDYIVIQNSSGTYNRTNIYQDGILVGYEDVDGKKRYVLPDHKGSAHLILNESGDVIEENLFSPFAEPLQGVIENKFSYEAKEYDSLVKDYDFHFRKYDPKLRIFTQPDTLIQNVYDSQSLNRYMFERGNPIVHVDPDGHMYWAFFLLFVAVGLAEGVYWLKTNSPDVPPDATPQQVQQARITYTAQATSHAGIGVSAAALTSGASASGTIIRYSAPTVGTLATIGVGSSVAHQLVDNRIPSVGKTATDTATSVLLGQALPSSYGQGQFMATRNIFNPHAVQDYFTGVSSSIISNKVSESNPAKSSGSSGGGRGGGGGSSRSNCPILGPCIPSSYSPPKPQPTPIPQPSPPKPNPFVPSPPPCYCIPKR